MAAYDYDLFTIGGGSGGVRGARVAAGYGARVALAEERQLGGTCVNVGCIPKKLFYYASHFREDFEDARAYGWDVPPATFSWPQLLARKDREIARLNGVYRGILDRAGVTVFEGRATLVDAHTVEVAGRRITAAHILIAVGGTPRLPRWPGREHAITSNEAFHLPALPERIVICGGGYIASEFAGIFHGMGVAVTQLYRGELFMRGFDDDLRHGLAEEMRRKGIDLRFGCNVAACERHAGGLRVRLSDGSQLDTDQLMVAIGRDPLTDGLGLDAAGVACDDNGAVLVDAYGKTNVDSIYAVGDVTDRIKLTPVALAEGMAVAATLFGGRPTRCDHRDVPSAVFSQPSIGTVGLTEAEARAACEIDVYRSRFRSLKHTLTDRQDQMLMKLVVARDTQQVLGVHVLGPDAGEIIQGFAVALKMGATKADLDRTIGIHPTAAEELVTMRTPV